MSDKRHCDRRGCEEIHPRPEKAGFMTLAMGHNDVVFHFCSHRCLQIWAKQEDEAYREGMRRIAAVSDGCLAPRVG